MNPFRSRSARSGALAAAVPSAILVAAIAMPVSPLTASGDGGVERFHDDARALERAMVDGYRAALRDDLDALEAAIERVAETMRPVEAPSGDDAFAPLRSIHRGFHAALDAARQAAGNGDLAGAVGQHYWLGEGCRRCHVQARKAGLLANAPLDPGS